ncbi:phage tail tube protein [Ignatzschineria cameli]|uniref:Phage tail protein n=1 Tax=Ignatzschineria cameli TaxID=2182793 RepID=A0ABX5L453_9GAMM|nr:phage tail tube protein [Ignatzschineria cameli]PWD90342.1 phage tail protein [Ignatzschineria cameli]PWD92225.1 phage tail protein [Ignatzschineria cameli]PWD93019.1 phage tail protein [Ignatzschineria cameli]
MSRNPMHYAKHMTIRSNGQEYPTLEGGTFTHSGMQRDDVTGKMLYGFTETAVGASVSVVVPANHETDFEDINNQTNVTIEVELDTGQIYLMQNAWNTTPVSFNGTGITLEFKAQKARRIG